MADRLSFPLRVCRTWHAWDHPMMSAICTTLLSAYGYAHAHLRISSFSEASTAKGLLRRAYSEGPTHLSFCSIPILHCCVFMQDLLDLQAPPDCPCLHHWWRWDASRASNNHCFEGNLADNRVTYWWFGDISMRHIASCILFSTILFCLRRFWSLRFRMSFPFRLRTHRVHLLYCYLCDIFRARHHFLCNHAEVLTSACSSRRC
jgi:hypothetical protein